MNHTLTPELAELLSDARHALHQNFANHHGRMFREEVEKRITEVLNNAHIVDPDKAQAKLIDYKPSQKCW